MGTMWQRVLAVHIIVVILIATHHLFLIILQICSVCTHLQQQVNDACHPSSIHPPSIFHLLLYGGESDESDEGIISL